MTQLWLGAIALAAEILRGFYLGFPEFESCHSMSFFTEAQLSKSVASTIPPCPQMCIPKYSQQLLCLFHHQMGVLYNFFVEDLGGRSRIKFWQSLTFGFLTLLRDREGIE